MFEMFLNSAKLFARGQLFQDFKMFLRQWLIGFVTVIVIAVALSFVNRWLGALVGGLVGGLMAPYLFKDLKYR